MNVMMVLAGNVTDIELKEEVTKYNIDYIVAVDGGYDKLVESGVKPNLLIGDMDSIKNSSDVFKVEFETKKDYSDFSLALKYIKENIDCKNIYVYGATSITRLDHVLSNLNEIDEGIKFITKNQLIMYVNKYCEIEKKEYEYYSFFAISNVKNLTLKGFEYELVDYNLNIGDSLCLSNKLVKKGIVSYQEGKLLMICSKEN